MKIYSRTGAKMKSAFDIYAVVSAAGLRTSKILSQKEFSYVRSSKNV
jgi:hypothetical protein